MTELWSDTLDAISAEGPLGTILHVGAGLGEALPALRRTDAQTIVLVEPDPDCLPALRRAAEEDARIRIVPAAIDTTDGTATLHRMTFRALSALSAPAELTDLFPALETAARHEVDTLGVASLFARHLPDLSSGTPPRRNVLISDAPPATALVLEALAEQGRLECFHDLLLCTSRTAFWQKSQPTEAVLDFVEGEGFAIRSRNDEDPDFPLLWGRLDPLARENRRLKAELSAASQAHRAETARAQDLETAQTRLVEAKEQAEAELGKLRGTLKSRTAERDDARAEFKRETARLRHELAERDERLDLSEAERRQLRDDLTRALETASIQQEELAELRARHGRISDERARLEDLLQQLTPRLKEAASHLRRLPPPSGPADAEPDRMPSPEPVAGTPSRGRTEKRGTKSRKAKK